MMRAVVIALWTCIGAGLSACGFQPLYAERGGDASAAMASVDVLDVPRPDPLGRLVVRALTYNMAPGVAASPKYELAISLKDRRVPLGIQIDSSVTRYNYTVQGAFTLRDRMTNAIVYSGRTDSVASYNVVTSQFSTRAAEQDAVEKAAQQIGLDIERQLAIFFTRSQQVSTENTTPEEPKDLIEAFEALEPPEDAAILETDPWSP
ncbi:MAG: LPS assembly lipoprotein LptE [Pseudomonadota bacterium]